MWQINNGTIKFIENAYECTLVKLNSRSLLSEMALSTEDSLLIDESFEEEFLTEGSINEVTTP
jgi:hypothetical protein